MHARFHVPTVGAIGDRVELPADEAVHLTRVLRLRVGDAVRIFNGRGAEFDAVIEQVRGGRVTVRADAPRRPAAEPRVAITLAQAVLKGDKMDDVIRDAVMLGVSAVQPLLTARSEVSRAALARGKRHERWLRVAISSTKQCGRAVVPEVREPIDFEELLHALSTMRPPGPALLLTEPVAGAAARSLADVDMTVPAEAMLIVGPEGGWTPEEVARASSPATAVTLGERTLRADAMPIVALSALFAIWKEF